MGGDAIGIPQNCPQQLKVNHSETRKIQNYTQFPWLCEMQWGFRKGQNNNNNGRQLSPILISGSKPLKIRSEKDHQVLFFHRFEQMEMKMDVLSNLSVYVCLLPGETLIYECYKVFWFYYGMVIIGFIVICCWL